MSRSVEVEHVFFAYLDAPAGAEVSHFERSLSRDRVSHVSEARRAVMFCSPHREVWVKGNALQS